MKNIVYIIVFLISNVLINAQTFQDNLSGETNGDFPSRWELIQGSAEVASLNGTSIIYFANKGIISPKIGSSNYLEDSFTLEFDAFYDEASRIPIHQYYEVRFWDGHSYLTLPNSQGFLNPMILYCHGGKLEGRINGTKVKYDGYLESMKDAKNVWRHITINYNNGSLKVKIDGFQSINIPNLSFKPQMISIGAYTVNLGTDLVRAIKNVNITGINATNGSTDGTNTGNNSGNNTNTYETNETINYNYNFPLEDGEPHQILQTNGNGTVSWVNDNHPETNTNTTNEQTTPTNSENSSSTGLEAIDEGNGIGWRLIGKDPANYANIGKNAVDLSTYSQSDTTKGATGSAATAMGFGTIASGSTATAMGTQSFASGDGSTSTGWFNKASGKASFAMGSFNEAKGENSFVSGENTYALGRNSTAMGYYTYSQWENNFAIGKFNKNEMYTLFEIGNGTGNASSSRSNALTVMKNGKVGIGTHQPKVKLHITGGTDASLSNASGYILLGKEDKTNIVFDNNEIIARRNGAVSPLYLQHEGGSVEVGGSVVHSSDRRLKKDIIPLAYGLNEILQLKPKAYNWKNRTQDHKSLGLIAQDVQPIIKELVNKNDKDGMLSVNYTELIPILINAIQEQQQVIEDLKNKNDAYKASIDDQEQKYSTLSKRIEQLEKIMNQ